MNIVDLLETVVEEEASVSRKSPAVINHKKAEFKRTGSKIERVQQF